jgi:hypothetical protein
MFRRNILVPCSGLKWRCWAYPHVSHASLKCDLREQKQALTGTWCPLVGPEKGPFLHFLLYSPHVTCLETSYWPGCFSPICHLWLAHSLNLPSSNPVYINLFFPASLLHCWRWRKYVSPKCCHLPMNLYGAKKQNITSYVHQFKWYVVA